MRFIPMSYLRTVALFFTVVFLLFIKQGYMTYKNKITVWTNSQNNSEISLLYQERNANSISEINTQTFEGKTVFRFRTKEPISYFRIVLPSSVSISEIKYSNFILPLTYEYKGAPPLRKNSY